MGYKSVEKNRINQRNYRKNNIEKCREYARKYSKEHRSQKRIYEMKKKEKIKEYFKNYYQANKERYRIYNHQYQQQFKKPKKYILYRDDEELRFRSIREITEFLNCSKWYALKVVNNDYEINGWKGDIAL